MNDGRSMSPWLEQAWLQRYLARELAADETEWFEVYLLDKPHLVHAIEADSDLRDAINDAAGAVADAPETPIDSSLHDTGPTPLLQYTHDSRRKNQRRRIGLALAASLVAGIGFGWMLAPGGPESGAAFIAGPARIVFDTWRGEAGAPQVYPGSPDAVFTLVEVGMPPDATNVRLRVGDSATPLPISSDGFASFLCRCDGAADSRPVIEFTSGGNPVRMELPLILPVQESAQ